MPGHAISRDNTGGTSEANIVEAGPFILDLRDWQNLKIIHKVTIWGGDGEGDVKEVAETITFLEAATIRNTLSRFMNNHRNNTIKHNAKTK